MHAVTIHKKNFCFIIVLSLVGSGFCTFIVFNCHEVTLILVKKEGPISGVDPEAIIAKAKEHLMKNGLPGNMIISRIIDEGNIRKTILREAQEGRFAAVAVRQTGVGRGILEKIFSGSLCNALFKDLENAALWVGN
jgi:hypothetical protein